MSCDLGVGEGEARRDGETLHCLLCETMRPLSLWLQVAHEQSLYFTNRLETQAEYLHWLLYILKQKSECAQVLAINHFPFFFLSLPDLLRMHTSARNCFTQRLFGNYSEGGGAAASVSRRWKSRWVETEGLGGGGCESVQLLAPQQRSGLSHRDCRGGGRVEGPSAHRRGVNLCGVKARTVTARLASPAAGGETDGRRGGEGRGHMSGHSLTFLHSS